MGSPQNLFLRGEERGVLGCEDCPKEKGCQWQAFCEFHSKPVLYKQMHQEFSVICRFLGSVFVDTKMEQGLWFFGK
jgi:hypothetical protein